MFEQLIAIADQTVLRGKLVITTIFSYLGLAIVSIYSLFAVICLIQNTIFLIAFEDKIKGEDCGL